MNYEGWAVVEVMGHDSYAGQVSEETVAGSQLLRIDVPAIDGVPAFTKYVSGGAIFSLTPCSEQIARAWQADRRKEPVQVWGLRVVGLEPQALPAPGEPLPRAEWEDHHAN